jgi:DNA-binding CsgD family transcriptional regulator
MGGQHPHSEALFDRELERTAIDRLLDGARRGRSGALVVRGEAGMGKTALLSHARDAAQDMRLLTATGVEPESQLAFAALHQLLRPVLDRIDRLPAVQASALRSALALAPGTVDNRFVIAIAVLGLLADVSADGPVLCVIDDAQWLDPPSADALTFVARRLDAEGIALLFASRDDEGPGFEVAGIPDRSIAGLDADSADRLLVERFDTSLAPAVRSAIVQAAQGNPLALIEIPEELTREQREGLAPLPRPMPLGHDLEEILLERVRRLPAPTQTLLLIASAEGSGEIHVTLAAAGALRIPPDALTPAESAGLVRSEGSVMVFRHPILRRAIYRGATLQERQAVHNALVEVLRGEGNADRRAWHRAALVLYPDDGIADELERTAERARSRSGHAAASAAMRRAAELTTSDTDRARRLVAAARAAWDAGRPDEASALLVGIEDDADADLATTAELRHVQGEFEFRCGVPVEGAAVLADGARRIADVDPVKALSMLFDAAQCSNFAGDVAGMIESAREASRLPIEDDRPEAALADLLGGMVGILEAKDPGARAALIAALDRLSDSPQPRWMIWAGAAASVIGDEARDDRFRRRGEALARASAAVGDLTMILERNAWSELLRGHLAAADVVATEGLTLSIQAGMTNPTCMHRAILAWTAAARGDEASCTSLAAEALSTATAHGLAPQHSLARWALALLDLGAGRWDDAATKLDALASPASRYGHPFVAMRALPDLVEAAARADRLEVARLGAARMAEYFAEDGPDWDRALAARCRALVEPDAGVRETLFAEAIALHELHDRPFARARTMLLMGEHLRRQRRRKEARIPLGAALEVFDELGANAWAQRTVRELRASGQTVRPRTEGSVTDLTPQEQQIVGMVVDGASNKDVAAQLFLSPRTVEYHLRSVYAKLGIASRTELIRLVLERGPSGVAG